MLQPAAILPNSMVTEGMSILHLTVTASVAHSILISEINFSSGVI